MKKIEYTKMAYLYDKFYAQKDYSKETEFIAKFIKNKKSKILDAGCGTGRHAKLLFEKGYIVNGFDISPEMVEIANSKMPSHFFTANLLDYTSENKYDLIYSFFAVFNHLKNYKQFALALSNLKKCTNERGIIIIDLHNPQKSGQKTDKIENATRIMRWRKCGILQKEFSKIDFFVDKQIYTTRHTFKIFNITKLKKISQKLGFVSIKFVENYDQTKPATKNSKNIQVILQA